jgi:hypothetical protein
MKKLLFLLVLVMVFPAVAVAEEVAVEIAASVVESEIPTQPFSWEQLATIAGAALATMLIVQLLKLPLDKVWKIPTRIIVFLIAAVVMLLATYFTQGLTWNTALLTILNAVVAALTAMGGYELTFAKLDAKKAIKTE